MLLSHLATGVRFFLHGPSVPMFGYPQSRCCQCPARRGAEVGGAQARQTSRHVANPPLPAADAMRMRLPAQRRRRRRTRSPSQAPYVRSLPLAGAATLALCFPKSCRSLGGGEEWTGDRRTARENELETLGGQCNAGALSNGTVTTHSSFSPWWHGNLYLKIPTTPWRFERERDSAERESEGNPFTELGGT